MSLLENLSVENLKKPKSIVLILWFALMTINIVSINFIIEGSSIEQTINLVFIVAFNFLMLLWCSYDSIERDGERLSSKFALMMVIFGIFTLIYYLFRSRGFSAGLISIGKLILFFIVSTIASAIIATVFSMIFIA